MSDQPTSLETFEVVGELPIIDAVTHQSITKGNTVQLDPSITIIPPLVEYGLIKPLAKKAATGKEG